ncbi:hypothetical protein N7456_001415 [Penicillium angulare]|uniref:Transmembrane protein 19 n=1 Tax=Penicillium angulare TaxID=116970 RepID=A0A9W9G6D7_9EURO|nr:hypothetical protein N7456_001415 [Penicillium angulare]
MGSYIGGLLLAFSVYRSYTTKTVTSLGAVVLALSSLMYVVHPWYTPLVILVIFHIGSARVKKVKRDIKARLTISAPPAKPGSAKHDALQVLSSGVIGTILCAAHAVAVYINPDAQYFTYGQNAADILLIGLVSHYCAGAADDWSGELGILSKSNPRLVTSWNLRQVPPGTNGGVSLVGTIAGFAGSFTIALAFGLVAPFHPDHSSIFDRALLVIALSIWGGFGSIINSFLGGILQPTIIDEKTGKVVEGERGQTAAFQNDAAGSGDAKGVPTNKRMEHGYALLSNNGIFLLTVLIGAVGAMGAAQWAWNVDMSELLPQVQVPQVTIV